ncbi:MAG: EAL domain-containing protein [Pseudomonadota bacterium]
MYRAKARGRNTYECYTLDLTRLAQERLTIDTRLRQALQKEEFLLCYQPLVPIGTDAPLGLEALVRWQPEGEAQISPDRFIPVAEESGLIVPLGEWILRTACAQACRWLDEGLPFDRVAVNVSVIQLRQTNFVVTLQDILRATGLPPRHLEIEITESGLMEQGGQTEVILRAIQRIGVRLTIDDFGTGYSSLAYLKQLPIDKLKIDRSFIRDITDDVNDRSIVTAIIDMAHTLELEVLAEGVETEAQLELLMMRGCDTYQGYLFSPPLPTDALPKVFADWRGTQSSHAQCSDLAQDCN